ncbi:unnamed protein product [Moneuplotes crassus]|uniref:Uncharacterized protein n=1 Tax=Euplotes crassus TaxID=5936 RepID=A0AAD1XGL3_EUPCR|nr:unnamed protein product [Moneuplotes crassus]
MRAKKDEKPGARINENKCFDQVLTIECSAEKEMLEPLETAIRYCTEEYDEDDLLTFIDTSKVYKNHEELPSILVNPNADLKNNISLVKKMKNYSSTRRKHFSPKLVRARRSKSNVCCKPPKKIIKASLKASKKSRKVYNKSEKCQDSKPSSIRRLKMENIVSYCDEEYFPTLEQSKQKSLPKKALKLKEEYNCSLDDESVSSVSISTP